MNITKPAPPRSCSCQANAIEASMKCAAPQPTPGENSRLLGDPRGPRGVAMPSLACAALARRDPPPAASPSPGDPWYAPAGESLGLKGKFPRAEQAGGNPLTPGKANVEMATQHALTLPPDIFHPLIQAGAGQKRERLSDDKF